MNTREGRPRIGITMGDPGGIGAEVAVKAHAGLCNRAIPFVIGDANVVAKAVECCDVELVVQVVDEVEAVDADPTRVRVLDLANVENHEWGELRAAFGRASLAYIERAIGLAMDGRIDAMVTAPINKQATAMAGSEFAGHTGMLADRTETTEYAMLLIEEPLRVSHVSTHVSLREACDLVTTERVFETVNLTASAVANLDVRDPQIAVAGLNPHASDGGVMGDTEAETIGPAIELGREAGIDVVGPVPPDTVFVRAADGEYDAVVAMYHDQGHIPVKLLGFSNDGAVSGVNVTIGLPIVRTSVDHGTAFDIAGRGIASELSLIQAVDVAAQLAEARGVTAA